MAKCQLAYHGGGGSYGNQYSIQNGLYESNLILCDWYNLIVDDSIEMSLYKL